MAAATFVWLADDCAASVCPAGYCFGRQDRLQRRSVSGGTVTVAVNQRTGWRLRVCSGKRRRSSETRGDQSGGINENILERSCTMAVPLMTLHALLAVGYTPGVSEMSTRRFIGKG